MSFKILSLLLVSLSFVLMEENITRENLNEPRFLQRRYSEGTLASDYSRTLDNMLKKNFVEWLLSRREKNVNDSIDQSKREAESMALDIKNQGAVAGSPETRDFINWLLKNMGGKRPALSKSLDDWKDVLRQEFLAWLNSADLCRPW
ncbi:gastric inhibitory polypeptide [Varanus komodoensis]|uniref:gastric inhibitory polypeptide n=1 Tax=Varanus komodoensis TaxID=61221 RepID=UPI001CF7E193|nr:gastric inhibitory polypeptide [Varanus komodoensis]